MASGLSGSVRWRHSMSWRGIEVATLKGKASYGSGGAMADCGHGG